MNTRQRNEKAHLSHEGKCGPIGAGACIALCLFFLAPVVLGSETRAVGSAFDKASGEFLYKELHRCLLDEEHCVVEYRDNAGKLLASKMLDYRGKPYRPSLVLKDYRSGSELSLVPPNDDALVVDAGFDNFVRSRWEIFDSGGSVQFNFLVPGRDTPIAMRADRDDRENCDVAALCIQVGLDSWLLARFVDPILLTYASDDRLLLRYEGPGNLASQDGSVPDVVIHYEHLELQEGELSDWGSGDLIVNDWADSRIAR